MLLFALLPGCALFGKKKRKAEPKIVRPVGTVLVVNEADRFVVVETRGATKAGPGVFLQAERNNAETALLKTAREQRRGLLAADIIAGEPSVGDDVYLLRGRQPPRPGPSNQDAADQ